MFDTKAELLEKIRLGESSFLEFKEVKFKGERIDGPRRDSLADGLAALANSHGGVFVLGVADKTREVVGVPLERLDAAVEFVRNVCMDSIEPALEHVVVDRLLLPSNTGEGVAVVKVDVPRSLFVHRSPKRLFASCGGFQAAYLSAALGTPVRRARPTACCALQRTSRATSEDGRLEPVVVVALFDATIRRRQRDIPCQTGDGRTRWRRARQANRGWSAHGQ